MNPERVPALHPDIIWRILDDGAVVVTPRAGNIRVLNQVGAAIWKLIDGNNTLSDIEWHLIHTFDVPTRQAHSDLQTFMEELERRDMIVWREQDSNEAPAE